MSAVEDGDTDNERELLAVFDDMAFRVALDDVRSQRGVALRELARQSGVSPSTITRIFQGKLPDVDTFAALIAWSDLDPRAFLHTDSTSASERTRTISTLEAVSVALSADPQLSGDDARLIFSVVRGLAQRLRREQP